MVRNPNLKPRESVIAVGDIVPDFTLLNQHREEWKLSEHVKKGDVVLCFYPLAFTEVCSAEMRCVNSDFQRWTDKGMTVVGISCDSFAANSEWAEKQGYTHDLLCDMHREVCKTVGLYWADLNVSSRGTIVIPKSEDGVAKASFVQARPPGQKMDWNEIMALV
jgi:peroxiredoxin